MSQRDASALIARVWSTPLGPPVSTGGRFRRARYHVPTAIRIQSLLAAAPHPVDTGRGRGRGRPGAGESLCLSGCLAATPIYNSPCAAKGKARRLRYYLAMATDGRGILITGGGSFLGDYIALALLAEGASVSLLLRPGAEGKLGRLARLTRWSPADVWSPGSLRGKARNHAAVIHSIGSLQADPAQGASYERLNLVAARNVANMCVSDGVERIIYISAARAPWHQRGYIPSKRAAEQYLRRSGLRTTIVRSPLLYARDEQRPLFLPADDSFRRAAAGESAGFGQCGAAGNRGTGARRGAAGAVPASRQCHRQPAGVAAAGATSKGCLIRRPARQRARCKCRVH